VVGRNPSYYPGDMRVLEAVDVPQLHHMVNVLVVSVKGRRPVFDEMAGGDADGDKYFVCWDPELVPAEVCIPVLPLCNQ
jgi:RNA-dependent RNA polymerase